MTSITIAELRQNPSPALDAVEHGQTMSVTRYRKPIAYLVPAARPAVSGADAMRALAITPVDSEWATQLEDQRDADETDDPWGRP